MNRLRAALGAIALLGLLAGCGAGKFADEPAPLNTSDAPSPSTPPSSTADVVPLGIRIPAIKVNNRQFMQVGLAPDRSLEVPPVNQPLLTGWYRDSRLPGDGPPEGCTFASGCVSSSILIGHVNGDGQQGVFAKLAQLKAGALIEIDRSDGKTAVFKANKTTVFKKAAFPTKSIYGDVTKPEIRLITCGPSDYDAAARSYREQTVTFATLVELKPTTP